MAIQSSFPKVADQVISFNKNIVDILTKINSVTTTTEPSVNVQIFDDNGVLRNFSIPSVTSLKAEIDRLNNNIKPFTVPFKTKRRWYNFLRIFK